MKSIISVPSHIIYDWDGTLVDSVNAHLNIANDLIKKYANNKTPWCIKKFTSEPTFHNYQKIIEYFGQHGEIAAAKLEERVSSLKKEHEPIFEYSIPMIKLCKKYNIKNYIVSSHEETSLKKQIINLNIDQYFTKIVGGTKSHPYKPDPSNLERALFDKKPTQIEKNNVMEKVWFIGDSWSDAECARRFGCFFIKIGCELEGFKNIVTIPNIKDIFFKLKDLLGD